MITNNFLAAGGDTYYAFAAASSQIESGLSLDTVVMDYITDELGGTVTKARYGEPQGRMTIIPPEKTDDGKITIGGLDDQVRQRLHRLQGQGLYGQAGLCLGRSGDGQVPG